MTYPLVFRNSNFDSAKRNQLENDSRELIESRYLSPYRGTDWLRL